MSLTIETLNLGSYPNDGKGDDLRTAFEKVQGNFSEIKNKAVTSATNLGSGPGQIFFTRVGNNLQLRTINTINTNMVITQDDNEINLAVKDSINSLVEDPNPTLGGNLNLNNFSLTGAGNINIVGDISAGNVSGAFHGSLTGDVFGTVSGNLNGDVLGNVTGNVTGNVFGSLTGNVLGNVTGNLNGDVNGNVFGNVTGIVNGTVIGTVSDISNHNLEGLSNVSNTLPLNGQILAYNGTTWEPQTLSTGVSKIVAGTNVTVTPSSGQGEVTINVSNSSVYPSEFNFGGVASATNPIELLLQATPVDFGSFTNPSSFNLELGRIVTSLNQVYTLSSSQATAVEGDTIIITLNTVNVPDDTAVPYIITGVSSNDISGAPLSGNFSITNNSGSILISLFQDLAVELETITISLDPSVYVTNASISSVSIPILDTTVSGGTGLLAPFAQLVDGGNPLSSSYETTLDGGVI